MKLTMSTVIKCFTYLLCYSLEPKQSSDDKDRLLECWVIYFFKFLDISYLFCDPYSVASTGFSYNSC